MPQARISASGVGKFRCTVAGPTPARSAMSEKVVVATPCSSCSVIVARMMRSRVSSRAAARFFIR
jgi:hypothetical protein